MTAFAGTRDRIEMRWAGTALLLAGVVVVAFGAVHMTWLITGAVLGLTVLVVALTAPLVLVSLMLMVGPIDLSFLTGGFKSLFPGMGGLDMNGIRLMAATAGFVAYILFEPRARAAARGPFGRIWVVFLLFAGASLVSSLDPIEGARLLLKLTYPLLTFMIVIGVADTRERAMLLMNYTLIAAVIVTLVLNPILVMQGGYRIEDGGFVRVGGLGKGDSPFSFYATAILMMAFTRYMLRMQLRYLWFSLTLLVWIALTMTRIAALASVAGICVIAALTAATKGNKKVLVGFAFIGAIACAALIPNVLTRSLGYIPTPGELFRIVRNPVVLYESINWQGRELLWAILWGAFMSSPIIGLGMGSSTAVIVETFPNQSVRVAHNEYMRLATDTGMIGVALFAAAVLAWLFGALRFSRRGDQAVREFAFPAVAAIIAWAIISITDNAFDYYTEFTQYVGFLLGGAVVMYSLMPGPAEKA